ncbi:anaerobic ribonucleoside-triphosphate reductase, partial [Streptococcus pneumoniae]
ISLGYIGLYEVATVFFGNNWETNPEAKEFTLDIIRDMKHRVEEWSDQYGYHFSIYSTPSESLTDRFCRLDTEKFGSIPDITDKEYY